MNKSSKRTLKVRDFSLSMKAVGDDGTFTGYGSVFGNQDAYNEVVAPGAFTETLAELKTSGRKLPVLWQHKWDTPIGVYNELAEDDHGLKCEGENFINDNVPTADTAHALLKRGAVTGLSIGYYVRESSFDEKTGIRTLKKLDLIEISLVTFPANDEARVEAVKLKLAHGELPTLPEFERILREAGFSKSQAAIVATRGLPHLLRSESGDKSATNGIAALLGAAMNNQRSQRRKS